MKKLKEISKKKFRKIIGLMSGTSCDGVDLALIRINKSSSHIECLKNFYQPYTKIERNTILDCLDSEKTSIKKLSQLNFFLAQIWADSIKEMLHSNNIKYNDIDLLASHGQTIYHQPLLKKTANRNIRSTLQLGDPAVLAQLTGITSIGDFRIADVALGGQGAPLVPYFDWIYFKRFRKNILSLNIGGISNITFVPADGDLDRVTAFDCGPGNILIDQLMQRLYEEPYDKDGHIAKLGSFSERIFKHIQKIDEFSKKKPPKSTGREFYGRDFVLDILKKSLRSRIQEPEIIHTVSNYTAYTIFESYKNFISPNNKTDVLVVSGGGGKNPFIMASLQKYFGDVIVKNTNEYDLDPDFKEAICFAVLANETIEGRPTNLPKVTGAAKKVLLGKICTV